MIFSIALASVVSYKHPVKSIKPKTPYPCLTFVLQQERNMKKYHNKAGNSGVTAYEIGKDYIKVWFVGHEDPYIYNYVKPGKEHVEQMKRCALAGEGLSTYISKYVKNNYFTG